MKKLVSIIIPVYNAEEYLTKCIDSVLKQTYKNIEIILINDGSSDNSSKICDDYQRFDVRIKVHHQTNNGVSSARNKGIELASGNYLVFIDSDDYINHRYIEKLMKNSDFDLVISSYQMIMPKNKQKLMTLEKKSFYSHEDIIKEITGRDTMYFFQTPWLKLYKTKIIKKHQIFFNNNMSYGEDICFVYDYVKHINTMTYETTPYYYNVIRIGSLSRKKINNIWESMYLVFKSGFDLFNNYNIETTLLFAKAVKTTLIYAIDSKITKEEFQNLCEEIKSVEEYAFLTYNRLRMRPCSYDYILLTLLKKSKYRFLRIIINVRIMLLSLKR